MEPLSGRDGDDETCQIIICILDDETCQIIIIIIDDETCQISKISTITVK